MNHDWLLGFEWSDREASHEEPIWVAHDRVVCFLFRSTAYGECYLVMNKQRFSTISRFNLWSRGILQIIVASPSSGQVCPTEECCLAEATRFDSARLRHIFLSRSLSGASW